MDSPASPLPRTWIKVVEASEMLTLKKLSGLKGNSLSLWSPVTPNSEVACAGVVKGSNKNPTIITERKTAATCVYVVLFCKSSISLFIIHLRNVMFRSVLPYESGVR